MANHAQSKKRIRQTARRTIANGARAGAIRTHLRKVEESIEGGDKVAAQDAFRAMQPKLMSGINNHIYHKNTVARKLSRLTKRIKAMSA
jgi:small subunit ribosomal protein S20